MKEARAVLARLERIEAMERSGCDPSRILAEVCLLVAEAECWLEREGPAALAARSALEECSIAIARSPVGRRSPPEARSSAVRSIR
jgi:hypothetical protein